MEHHPQQARELPRAFDGFDAEKIARYNEKKIAKLMLDAGIIRNRQKINAAVKNARAFLKLKDAEGSFAAYSWKFVGGKPKLNRRRSLRSLPAKTPQSEAFSKDLIARGFSFVGPTVVYAHMQATGMVNDHLVTCFRWAEVQRRSAVVPMQDPGAFLRAPWLHPRDAVPLVRR